ncbi:MAG TPA: zinc-dependent metalloprotease [Gemmatimonadaceae bacterium]
MHRARSLPAAAAVALLASTLLATGCASAGARPAPGAPRQAGAAAGRDSGNGAGRGEPAPKPYAQVVTPGATTRDGLFRTHRVGSKLLFEIPATELDKDLLLVTQIAKTAAGIGYGGEQLGRRVVRWERRGNQVLLRDVSFDVVADTSSPIHQAVRAANFEPIIAIFNVEGYGPDSAAVIDVTKLYTQSPVEFGVRNRIRGSIDAQRSFVERVASFPDNVEVEATQTFNVQPPPQQGPPPFPGFTPPPPEAASVLMHWSMVRLPERPMMPRLYDDRVGYFSIRQIDYGADEQRAPRRRYITRWRLECSEQRVDSLCVPVKPITWYIDPATPPKWVPWLKRGIEAWQPAFEAAGFANAIVAKDAPSPAEDPDWSAEDARYSTIRWLPSTIENAQGPHVNDPRTGEIIEADIRFYHNVMNLLRDWYWVQVGPLDPRARDLPLPDSLMGRLVEYVAAHEVGHSLGFQHNMKASSTYDPDSLRSASFLRRMGGHTPTLMDYSRFNYVAQPEDSIPLDLLIPQIGPYDKFATMWGYKPIPGADTPEEERATLDRWARMQDTIPHLRFSVSDANGADPGSLTEAVGDADAVRSTELGLRNIRRLVPMLIPATTEPGRDWSDLEELYGRLVGQWTTELNHVVAVVGGAESQEKYAGQEGVRFEPLPAARQREAVRFLTANAFATPEFFLDAEILRRIEVEGAMARVRAAQVRILENLHSDDRMTRLIEFEALADRPQSVYTLGEMIGDVRRGVWSEIASGRVAIDPFRRNLQRSYLEMVDEKLNDDSPIRRVVFDGGTPRVVNEPRQSSDAAALLAGELKALDAQLRTAIPRAADRTTRLHLEAARTLIERILDPRE